MALPLLLFPQGNGFNPKGRKDDDSDPDALPPIVNDVTAEKQTPLILAALRGHTGALGVLAGLGEADVNAADCRGDTPLHLTAQAGKLR